MRFSRYPVRNRVREWTPRRVSAAARAVRRERDDVALFPELARYKTVDERKKSIDDDTHEFTTRMRMSLARDWRRARLLLRAMPPRTRRGLIRYWNESGCPGDACYLLDALHAHFRSGSSPWSWLREQYQVKLIAQRKLSRVHLNETFSRFTTPYGGRRSKGPQRPTQLDRGPRVVHLP